MLLFREGSFLQVTGKNEQPERDFFIVNPFSWVQIFAHTLTTCLYCIKNLVLEGMLFIKKL